MKMTNKTILLCAAVALLLSCGNRVSISAFDNAPIVAERTIVNGDTVITCFFERLPNEAIDFPLSKLIENLRIVQLENTDEAFISRILSFASENYIGFFTMQLRYLLFDKTGRFISQISRQGQGPGEHSGPIYDAFIDEPNRRVYILPWHQQNILVYTFDGRMLPSIPLSERVPKGKFRINTEQQIVQMGVLPFRGGNDLIAWTQTFDGEIIDYVPSAHRALQPDFSNEVFSYRNTSAFSFQLGLLSSRPDTLFHYIQGAQGQGRLKPVYVVDFGNRDAFFHWHTELPHHFITIKGENERVNELGQFYRAPWRQFIVDKNTLQGAWVNFVFDELGNLPVPPQTVFRDGFFIANYYPHELKEGLHQVLNNPNSPLSRAKIEELRALYERIDEYDDNNIIIVGRVTQ